MSAGTSFGESGGDPGWTRLGPRGAPTPIVIAVPHAGRAYPAEILDQSRLPRAALETIEDRHADLLVADAVAAGAVAIVARTARAVVDLNRDPREIDPAIVRGGGAALNALVSPKVTGGLGVVPSRIAAGGVVWRHPLERAELTRRLATLHEPYHEAIATALDAAHAAHGIAVLIDCHSMPPLGLGQPSIVLGDRHGASAAARFVRTAADIVARRRLLSGYNRPYAGGHTLDRHGHPAAGRHALQFEVDRALYLDPLLREPGPGLAATRALFAEIAAALAREASGFAEAAE